MALCVVALLPDSLNDHHGVGLDRTRGVGAPIFFGHVHGEGAPVPSGEKQNPGGPAYRAVAAAGLNPDTFIYK